MTTPQERRRTMRTLLAQDRMLVVPGAYDGVSAKLVAEAGFPAVYIGSYATAASRLGLPDVGLVTMEEMARHAGSIVEAVDVPVLADAENGFTNAANIWRTVRTFERAGVAGIHIEDHAFGKHANVPQILLEQDQIVQRIKAALDARDDENLLIIARTDAAWALGDVDEAVRRMSAFIEAGADMVFPAGITPDKLAAVRHRIPGKVVVTDKPGFAVADEEKAGADVVLYYGLTLLASYHGVRTALARFKETRDAGAVPGVRESTAEFERFIGYDRFVARATKYGSA